jgi:hypothetical protein
MTTTKRPAKTRNKRPTLDEQQQADAIMRTVFQLAKQAYLARQRFIAQGVPMAPLPYDERVRQVLGIEAEQAPKIEVVEKPGLVTATKELAKRLLS